MHFETVQTRQGDALHSDPRTNAARVPGPARPASAGACPAAGMHGPAGSCSDRRPGCVTGPQDGEVVGEAELLDAVDMTLPCSLEEVLTTLRKVCLARGGGG